MRRTVAAVLVLASIGLIGSPRGVSAQPKPDFSGIWVFNQAKSLQPGRDGKVVLAPMLGDLCIVTQTAKSITFEIKSGDLKVTPVYKLDGTGSVNVSPGEAGQPGIPVTSRLSWNAGKLIIDSVSKSIVKGVMATVESRRTLSLDKDGNLIIEYSGSAASGITPSRSVYSKPK